MDMIVKLHAIAVDGYPDMDALTGRVAFIFDGCIVSGWPLKTGERQDGEPVYSSRWEADSDVGRVTRFEGVTHWIEFPQPLHQMERS